MTNHETRALRAVLTVTVETRPDGGHYFDQSDFAAHAVQWVKSTLRGQHAVDQVTVAEAAVSVPPPATRADDQAALRQRIAEALWPLTEWDGDQLNAERAADAVLAVLPESVDRAAVLREAADGLDRLLRRHPPSPATAAGWRGAWAWLREQADESAESGPCVAGEQQNETPEAEREPDPDCEHCDGSGLDPDAYFVEGDVWTHAPCSECLPEDDDEPEPTAERVKHSGPETKFCVLCLSGEHERVAEAPE